MSLSPGLSLSLREAFSGSTIPITERPNLMYSSSIVCPPASTAPASAVFSMAPAIMSASVLIGMSSVQTGEGKAAMFMTHHGMPPMAYTSESALAAAVWPKSRGSLPRAPRMSTVCTSAIPGGGAFMTTASSLLEKPCAMRPSGSGGTGMEERICSSNSGAVLAAQPAPLVLSIRQNAMKVLLWRARGFPAHPMITAG